ncbi:MAG TPA: tRNA dihydrouridine synthase DusB [Actinomycetes bacterium]|nr:tRNA dihydrouridine synthase DusB [Actinomycetes bacterium]
MTTSADVEADATDVALRPLPLGRHQVWPPVVLAPMAGITNSPFRLLCREQAEAAAASAGTGAGLYVSEMITSRALVERDAETMRMIRFAPAESPRSIQLYGVDPAVIGKAVAMVVDEDLADHVDLNFGCPVPKVTRQGGGSALPWRRRLFREIVRAAVASAGGLVPVTVKMRKGIDDEHLTYLDAGRIAEQEGVAWVALHARTAAQHYGGTADWEAIARLKEHVTSIPVLGNGDVWEGADALSMLERTGADGVVVGRGCLGRPWLFADLAAAFAGTPRTVLPSLREVMATMRRHAELLCEHFGPDKGCREIRKHIAWYTKGFAVGSTTRRALAMVSSLAELDALIATLDLDQPFPREVLGLPRGRTTGSRHVVLPEGWLDSPDALDVPEGAELDISGG